MNNSKRIQPILNLLINCVLILRWKSSKAPYVYSMEKTGDAGRPKGREHNYSTVSTVEKQLVIRAQCDSKLVKFTSKANSTKRTCNSNSCCCRKCDQKICSEAESAQWNLLCDGDNMHTENGKYVF